MSQRSAYVCGKIFFIKMSQRSAYVCEKNPKHTTPISCHWSLSTPPENIRKPLTWNGLMFNSEKQNVSFSQLLCIASTLGWSLNLKIALRGGSAMFSVTGSNSLYLQIFRFFTIFEKKLFRVLAVSDSVFKISPFSFILILSLMRGFHDLLSWKYTKTGYLQMCLSIFCTV